ncbi:hypothetical protein AX769_22560 (plasmid) [Frondihabitans sp. PAMC 28766]|uniref:hypothetical protein n=1 Tax=Frondihabitans sp. PAMC 28766 TaxID=1795630 RepID=UPI00078B558C|nr:hypothetical protein [Frondihabitans sp. PAMC 28766]AMM22917.1 hypothetical protein AX769_22560 [Frondihabitans sp. PAMC 28766]
MRALRLVNDLEEAGLHEDAVTYAKHGVVMDQRGWDTALATFLVTDAFNRDDTERAVTIRRDWFTRFPTATSFASLRHTAEQTGVWQQEQNAAEARLAEHDAPGYTAYLLDENRVDQAWEFATAHTTSLLHLTLWLNLCDRHALNHPADTLPIYRHLVTDTLTITDKRNYKTAANILKALRTAATHAGPDAATEFETFLAETIDHNRRRPTCIDVFTRSGLIRRP